MILTILAEPRSGSTNLTNWFYFNKKFTVLFEPITNPTTRWFKNNIPPEEWTYTNPHMLIKEVYNTNTDFSKLLKISDKIIILYRENLIEQNESWLNAKHTNNWSNQWVIDKKIYNDSYTKELIDIKNGLKKNYIDKNYFTISYEELYYNNGFQKIVEYLDLDCVKNEKFPHGIKYRINTTEKNKLI